MALVKKSAGFCLLAPEFCNLAPELKVGSWLNLKSQKVDMSGLSFPWTNRAPWVQLVQTAGTTGTTNWHWAQPDGTTSLTAGTTGSTNWRSGTTG